MTRGMSDFTQPSLLKNCFQTRKRRTLNHCDHRILISNMDNEMNKLLSSIVVIIVVVVIVVIIIVVVVIVVVLKY